MKKGSNKFFGRQLMLMLTLSCSLIFINKVSAADADTVYIDPTFTGNNSDGTLSAPYTTWGNISDFLNNTYYLQKRGTKDTIVATIMALLDSNIVFGVYGSGTDYAYIHNESAGNSTSFLISASYHCKVEGFYLTGSSYNTQCGVRVNDHFTTAENSGNGTQILNCYIKHFKWGIRMMKLGNSPFDSVLVKNVKINDIYSDGMFIQGWGQPLHGVHIDECYIDSVNMAYQLTGGGGADAEGDGIQFSRLIDGWKVTNTVIDRRNSSNKFCIIHHDEGATKTCSGLIENCTIYAPSIGTGGSAIYLQSLDSVVIQNNRILVNEKSIALMNRNGSKVYLQYNILSKTDESLPENYLNIGGGPNYISNNTFYGGLQVVEYAAGAASTYFYNNIFYDAGAVFGLAAKSATTNYNLYYLSTGGDTEKNSIYDMDPLFVNAESGNFKLRAGSPCINSGIDLGLTEDINGTSLPQGAGVDIGAYEFIRSDTIPPCPPTRLRVQDKTCISFILTWQAAYDNEGIMGYLVYKDHKYYTFSDSLSAPVTGLTQETWYLMSVVAKDFSGNLSDTSIPFNILTSPSFDTLPPTAPSGLTVTRYGQTNFTLAWTPSLDNRKDDKGVFEYDIYLDSIYYTSTSDTSYIISNLSISTDYDVYIVARDSVNNHSEPSAELTVTTLSECETNSNYINTSMETQTGTFTVEFDVVPQGDAMDGIVGFSNGPAGAYSHLACLIQFNSDGYIKVRSGSTYTFDSEVLYYSGTLYHFEVEVSIATHTYDVYVTPERENKISLAKGYAFRTEQASVQQLNNYAVRALICTLTLSNFEITRSEKAIENNVALNFDFGTNSSPDNWNNVNYGTTAINNVINAVGDATEVGFTVYDPFAGINFSGPTGLSVIPTIPDDASSDSFYGSGTTSSGGFILDNLNPSTLYTVIIFSGRTGSGEVRETQFVITGDAVNTLAINSYGNTTPLIGSYYPAADGTLDIFVKAGPNNTNSSLYYYLNTLQVLYDSNTISTQDFSNMASAQNMPEVSLKSSMEDTEQTLVVYPNPASGFINVEVSSCSEMKIFDIYGQLLNYEKLNSGNNRIQLNLKSGVYYLKVSHSDKSVRTTKVIIQ